MLALICISFNLKDDTINNDARPIGRKHSCPRQISTCDYPNCKAKAQRLDLHLS